MINVHNVLSVVQRTLVLLENANKLVSQTRICNILRSVDQGLEEYGKEPPTNSEEFLFGKEFCPKLKAKVESDKTLAQVVQISQRYQPYDQKSHQSTLGCSKKQFFRPGPAGNSGSRRAMFPHPTSNLTSHTISTPILRSSPLSKPTNTQGDWKSPEQLTTTTNLFSSTQFESAPSALTYTNTSSRKGCLVPRELGMPDQRSLDAIHHQRVSDTPIVFARAAQVYHHSQQGTTISSAGGSVQTEGERGSLPSTAVRSSHNQSDLCCPQKRRRLETNYRPEIPELPYSTASLQDGGSVHAAKHHQSGVVHGEIGSKGCT